MKNPWRPRQSRSGKVAEINIPMAFDRIPFHLPQFGHAFQDISDLRAQLPPFRFAFRSRLKPISCGDATVRDRWKSKSTGPLQSRLGFVRAFRVNFAASYALLRV